MCKRMLSAVCVLALIAASSAVAATFWDNTSDHQWMTLANWNGDPIPGSGTQVFLCANANINNAQAGLCGELNIAQSSTASLSINAGGSLTAGGWANVGTWGGNGTLNVNGGQFISSSPIQVGIGTGSTGTFNVNGGSAQFYMLIIGKNSGSGVLNVNGGTVTSQATGIDWNTSATSKINLAGGTFIFNGDASPTVNWGIANGMIVGYNGTKTVQWDYNVTNPGKTTMWAIPEPVTMGLMAIGGLLLSRRK